VQGDATVCARIAPTSATAGETVHARGSGADVVRARRRESNDGLSAARVNDATNTHASAGRAARAAIFREGNVSSTVRATRATDELASRRSAQRLHDLNAVAAITIEVHTSAATAR